MSSSWFAEPSLPRPMPQELLPPTSLATSSSFLPQHRELPAARPPGAQQTRRRAAAAAPSSSGPPDPSADAPGSAPIGPCRVQLDDGTRCAVPYKLKDLDGIADDGEEELLVVELRAADGQPGWLEDRSLQGVFHVATDTIFSLAALRRLVQTRVGLLGGAGSSLHKTRNIRRNLFKVCEPIAATRLLVVALPVASLRDLQLVSGEDPPRKRSA